MGKKLGKTGKNLKKKWGKKHLIISNKKSIPLQELKGVTF
jgi:hypothetical protein